MQGTLLGVVEGNKDIYLFTYLFGQHLSLSQNYLKWLTTRRYARRGRKRKKKRVKEEQKEEKEKYKQLRTLAR